MNNETMPTNSPRRKLWLVLWIVLMFVLLVGLRPPSVQLDYDVGIWTLCARDMNQGGLLYEDIWDHKGPMVFMLYSVVYRLVGYSPVAINCLGILLLAVLAVEVFFLTRMLFGRFAGAAAATFLLLAGVFPSGQFVGPELMMEVWMVPAFIAALVGLRRRQTSLILLSGILAGMAFQVHGVVGLHIAVLVLVVAAYTIWVARGPIRQAVGLALVTVGGLLVPFAGFCLLFHRLGTLNDYFGRWIIDNLMYVRGGRLVRGFDTAHQLVLFVRDEMVANPVFWLAAFTGAMLMIVLIARRQEEWQEPQRRWEAGFLIMWLLFAAGGIALSGRYYPHYLMQALPVAAIMAGLAAKHTHQLLRRLETSNYARSLLLAAGVMLLLSMLPRIGPALQKWRGVLGGATVQRPAAIAGEWLSHRAAPGATVFVWKFHPLIYLKSQTRPVNRFYSYQYFDQISLAPPSRFQSYLSSIWREDLRANPPQYMLIGRQAALDTKKAMLALGMEQLLSEGYVELAEVAGYRIYERGDGSS